VKRAVTALAALLLIAGACKPKQETAANLNVANKVAMRMVRLYYESPQMLLVAETRNVALPESAPAAVPVVMRELLKGPVMPTSLRLFPPDTVVRAAYLLPGGTAIVDLGGPTLTGGWGTGSHQELMAVHSIVQTVASNFAEARSVRILVNGSPSETLAGHLSLAKSFAPVPALVDPRSR
jgi:Sporulation and spore germination